MLETWTRHFYRVAVAVFALSAIAPDAQARGKATIITAAEQMGAELALCWETAGHDGAFSAQIQFCANRNGRTSDVLLGAVALQLRHRSLPLRPDLVLDAQAPEVIGHTGNRREADQRPPARDAMLGPLR